MKALLLYCALLGVWLHHTNASCEHIKLAGCECEYPRAKRFEMFCQQRGFSGMPKATVHSLAEGVVVGNFSHNRISSIPDGYFKNMMYYDILDFSSNSLSTVNNMTLSGLESKLHTLNLSYNNIASKDLRDRTFVGFIRLKTLNLEGNRISNPCNIQTNDVVTYILAKNGIRDLRDHCFADAGDDVKVETLDLHGNAIYMIDRDAFDGLKHLQKLVLDGNRLSSVESGFEPLVLIDSFSSLSMRSNGIITIDSFCQYVWKNIEMLDFSHNQLIDIKRYCFIGYGNRLDTDITPPALELNFAHNKIEQVLQFRFDGLAERLAVLKLSHNRIELVENTALKQLEKLKTLDLSNNLLEELTFLREWESNNLAKLYLSNNRISELPTDVFDKMTKLTTLSLSGNHLLHVDTGAFRGMGMLRELSLANNLITNLADGVFRGVEQLQKLSLSSNALVTLKKCSFADVQGLLEFHFENNLIHCDCDMQWLLDLVDKVNEQGKHAGGVQPVNPDVCHSPENSVGKPISNQVGPSMCPMATTGKDCFGTTVVIDDEEKGKVNVTWSIDSTSSLKKATLTQVDVETDELLYDGVVPVSGGPVLLKGFEGERIMKVCVFVTLVTLQSQKDCAIWPNMIKKPTVAPSTTAANLEDEEEGMHPGAKAAIALAIILIIIIILIVLVVVYLWKTKKYRGLIPNRYSSQSNGGASSATESSPMSNGDHTKPDPLDFRQADEEEGRPMMASGDKS